MTAFAYSAINSEGLELFGEIHAPTVDAAREHLRARGLLAERLDELPAEGEQNIRTALKKVKPKTLQVFSRPFASLIMTAMMLFIVPVFQKMFTQLHGKLPMLTRIIVAVSNLLRHDWFIVFPAIFLCFFLARRWKRTENGRRIWDRIKLQIPM